MTTANWLTSILESPERLGSIITRANWGIVAALFIGAVLTAFVIWAGGKRDILLQKIESAKDQRIADANKTAGTANERAGVANLKAAEANERAAKLEHTAEEAKLEQEKIRNQNLTLQSQLEQERTARQKLEPRTINQEQGVRLIESLKFAKGSTINIRATNSSAESSQFAEQIRAVSVAAGWNAPPVFYNMVAGSRVAPGLTIIVKTEKSQIGILLQQSLKTIGFETNGVLDPSVPENAVLLIVGQKP